MCLAEPQGTADESLRGRSDGHRRSHPPVSERLAELNPSSQDALQAVQYSNDVSVGLHEQVAILRQSQLDMTRELLALRAVIDADAPAAEHRFSQLCDRVQTVHDPLVVPPKPTQPTIL